MLHINLRKSLYALNYTETVLTRIKCRMSFSCLQYSPGLKLTRYEVGNVSKLCWCWDANDNSVHPSRLTVVFGAKRFVN